MIAGDLGDHSESEDDEEGEAEKTRWEEIFFSLFYHFTSGARKIFCYHFFLSLLFQVEGGAGRGEAGQDGAGDDPPGQPRPPPGLAL